MIARDITIGIKEGLQARPVAIFVQVASKYQSTIYVEVGNKRVNAKSIMGMMTLGLTTGENVKVTADGVDEEEAVNSIETYLGNAPASC